MKSKLVISIEAIIILVLSVYIFQNHSSNSAWEMKQIQVTANQAAEAFNDALSSNDEYTYNDATCKFLATYNAVCSISEHKGSRVQYAELMNEVYGRLLSDRSISKEAKTEIINALSAIQNDYNDHTLISGILRKIISEIDNPK